MYAYKSQNIKPAKIAHTCGTILKKHENINKKTRSAMAISWIFGFSKSFLKSALPLTSVPTRRLGLEQTTYHRVISSHVLVLEHNHRDDHRNSMFSDFPLRIKQLEYSTWWHFCKKKYFKLYSHEYPFLFMNFTF